MFKNLIQAVMVITGIILMIPIALSSQELGKIDTITPSMIEKRFKIDATKAAKLKQLIKEKQDRVDIVIKDKSLKPAERHLALKRLYEDGDRNLDALLTEDEKENFYNLMREALWEKRRARLERLETKKKFEQENERSRKVKNRNDSKLRQDEKANF